MRHYPRFEHLLCQLTSSHLRAYHWWKNFITHKTKSVPPLVAETPTKIVTTKYLGYSQVLAAYI